MLIYEMRYIITDKIRKGEGRVSITYRWLDQIVPISQPRQEDRNFQG